MKLGLQRGGGSSLLPQTKAYIDACPTPLSPERVKAVNELIKDLIAGGIWAKTDKMGVLANESVNNAAINLRYPSLGAVPLGTLEYVNANPTMYETNKGIVRNNVGNNHIYTRYQPDGSNQYKLDSACIAVWVLSIETTNYKTNMSSAGSMTALQSRRGDGTIGHGLNSASLSSTVATPSIGFFGASRLSSAGYTVRQNNTEIAVTNSSQNLPSSVLALAGIHGSTANYSIVPHSFYYIGGGLTSGAGGEFEKLYLAWQKYLQTMGVIA